MGSLIYFFYTKSERKIFMKRILLLILALTLLAGCSGGGAEPAVTTEPTAGITTPVTEPVTEPATTPATEPAVTTEPLVDAPYTNPLTGEGRMEPQTRRPYGVVINNIRAAQPLHGIGEADLLF